MLLTTGGNRPKADVQGRPVFTKSGFQTKVDYGRKSVRAPVQRRQLVDGCELNQLRTGSGGPWWTYTPEKLCSVELMLYHSCVELWHAGTEPQEGITPRSGRRTCQILETLSATSGLKLARAPASVMQKAAIQYPKAKNILLMKRFRDSA